ncbi:MAG TPA: cupin domain-containing protein [Nevskiaceae bacterium]|nr:cupin domain-containing protein [Nevskiaceae bacterium]
MRPYHVPDKLHADLRQPAIVHSTRLPWVPSPTAGVERRFLDRDGAEVARATSIVRYAPRSSFPPHTHGKGEEYLVLEGVFSDAGGDYEVGTYVRNPPGSRHAPFTHDGCFIFVKLRQMADDERDTTVVRTHLAPARPGAVPGLVVVPLYADARERVTCETLQPGTQWRDRGALGGEELLVLEGDLRYGDEVCHAGTWLRFPAGQERAIASVDGCRLWCKRGHLPA